jgi:ATP-dependent Zn protease
MSSISKINIFDMPIKNDSIDKLVFDEINNIVNTNYAKTKTIITKNKDSIKKVSEALLNSEKQELTGEEVFTILDQIEK